MDGVPSRDRVRLLALARPDRLHARRVPAAAAPAREPQVGTGEVPSPVEPLRPAVSLIIAAHDEQDLIERKLENALSLDYPRAQLEIIVASDGSSDRTIELARAVAAREGRIHVLDLTRRGKVPAQDAAVEVRRRGDPRLLGRQRVLGERRARDAGEAVR